MRVGETKELAFKRLATKRTNRILKDISLLGNLSDRRNYKYEQKQVSKIFGAIEAELRDAKARFSRSLKTARRLEL